MEEKLFNRLFESVKETGKIIRGEEEPGRVFSFDPKPKDIVAIRAKTGKSQDDFARMIGVSPGTLKNWEQGRRSPAGPARTLLKIVSKHPDIVEKSFQ